MTFLKRALIGLALIAVVAAGAAYAFREPITWAIFERAAERNLTRDRVAELPDGLHVFICGSGAPFADPNRFGACVGVLAGQRAFVFDVGSGGGRRLGAMGFPIDRLEAVYLTHLHSDHFDGLGEVLLGAWILGERKEPMPLRGPFGVHQIAEGLHQAYSIDKTYRILHHGTDVISPDGFGAEGSAIKADYVLEEDDLRIAAFAVDHSPIEPAFGFRIDYKGRSVVISGDTTYDARLITAAKGADLLLHEALQPEMTRVMGRVVAENGQQHLVKIFKDIEDYHTTPEEAARAAAEAGVDHLVLYHLVPSIPPFMAPAFLRDAGEAFDGPITLAEDGMLISLPAGGEAIDFIR